MIEVNLMKIANIEGTTRNSKGLCDEGTTPYLYGDVAEARRAFAVVGGFLSGKEGGTSILTLTFWVHIRTYETSITVNLGFLILMRYQCYH